MDFLQGIQGINGGTVALIAVGLCLLCFLLPILFSGLSMVGAVIGIFADLLGALFGFLSGGPAQWCGCLVAIGACGFIVMLVALVGTMLANCPTNPTNFCALFGR